MNVPKVIVIKPVNFKALIMPLFFKHTTNVHTLNIDHQPHPYLPSVRDAAVMDKVRGFINSNISFKALPDSSHLRPEFLYDQSSPSLTQMRITNIKQHLQTPVSPVQM